MKQLVLMLFVLVGLCACVAPAPFEAMIYPAFTKRGSDVEGLVTIYVIRDIPKAGSIHDALVQIDHVPQGQLGPGAYLSVNVKPGTHEVRIAWPIWLLGDPKDIAINAPFEANRTYYFLMNEENTWRGQTIVSTTTIEQIAPDVALPRLRRYTRSEPDQAISAASGHINEPPAQTASQALSTPASVSSQHIMPTAADLLNKAQKEAVQLGCRNVQSTGSTTFVAQCAGYGVAIDCDGDKCRPVHTISE